MLRERAQTIGSMLVVADTVTTTVAFCAAYALRSGPWPGDLGALAPFALYLPLVPIVFVIWAVSLRSCGLYRSFRTMSAPKEAVALLQSTVVSIVALGAVIFVLKLNHVSRVFIIAFAAISWSMLVAERFVLRLLARKLRRKGYNYRSILVVGRGTKAAELRQIIDEKRHWGLRLVHADVGQHLAQFLTAGVVDEVIFAITPSEIAQFSDGLATCERVGIQAHLCLEMDQTVARAQQTELAGLPLLTFSMTPTSSIPLAAKRTLDLIISSLLVVGLAPVLLLIAAVVKMSSPGPVLFRQTRIGLNGRRFELYKFRSMDEDADARQLELAALNQMSGPTFKMKDDPRVTALGRFLRRYSLDELPQLWNVFKGEMSLVGPRPPVPGEVSVYEISQRRRLSMKPGLTCLWQVSGRSKITSFEKWVELDLRYIDTWSLGLDFQILFQTIPAVVFGRGAV